MIESDPVAASVRTLMQERTEWTGTASDLLGALAETAGERIAKSKSWPVSPRALAGRLRRAATFLRKIGIDLDHYKVGRARTRIIRITSALIFVAQTEGGAQPSAPSASTATANETGRANEFAGNGLRTMSRDADDERASSQPTVRANFLKSNGTTAADDADANRGPQSGPKSADAGGWSGRV